MLGIGFPEMVLIAGIALVVIGPEKFPDFAKLVVRTIRDLRGYVDEMKEEVSKELKPIKKEMDSLSRIDPEKYIDSLTKEAPEKKENPALHEEDRKVMEEAGAYDEDPYGWEGSEPGGYDQPAGGTAPEDTVGYGESLDADTDSATEDATADAAPEEEGSAGDTPAESDAGTEGGEDAGGQKNDTPAADPEFEFPEDALPSSGDKEPDVWTGR